MERREFLDKWGWQSRKEDAVKQYDFREGLAMDLDNLLKTEKRSGYVKEGELYRKEVEHDETVLRIGEPQDAIIIVAPCDLDDFVRVGDHLKVTIEVE